MYFLSQTCIIFFSGSLGGNMGLFLGCSIITVIEIILLPCICVNVLFRKISTRNVTPDMNEDPQKSSEKEMDQKYMSLT